MRPRSLAALVAAFVLVELAAVPAAAGGFITRRQALDRPNIRTISGVHEAPLDRCANDDRTFDLRRFESVGNFDSDNNLSFGNDCAAKHTVVVGGTVTGTISHSLTWDEVKTRYDADALRFEGEDWLASFDLSVENVEDGFAPRVTEGTQDGIWTQTWIGCSAASSTIMRTPRSPKTLASSCGSMNMPVVP